MIVGEAVGVMRTTNLTGFKVGDIFEQVQKYPRHHWWFRITQDCRRLKEIARTISCAPSRCICAMTQDDWIFDNFALIASDRVQVGTGQYIAQEDS